MLIGVSVCLWTIGHRDTSLSEKGVRQAQLLSERLQHEQFTHVFTSDLQRAKQVHYIAQCTSDFAAFEPQVSLFSHSVISDGSTDLHKLHGHNICRCWSSMFLLLVLYIGYFIIFVYWHEDFGTKTTASNQETLSQQA